MSLTRLEQETIIRWDRASDTAIACTAYKRQADKWRKLGWPVQAVDRYGWRAVVPDRCRAVSAGCRRRGGVGR
jgi:hypothetical protein